MQANERLRHPHPQASSAASSPSSSCSAAASIHVGHLGHVGIILLSSQATWSMATSGRKHGGRDDELPCRRRGWVASSRTGVEAAASSYSCVGGGGDAARAPVSRGRLLLYINKKKD